MSQSKNTPTAKWLPEVPIADINPILFGIVSDIITFQRHALADDNDEQFAGLHFALYCLFIHANDTAQEHITLLPDRQIFDWAQRVNASRTN